MAEVEIDLDQYAEELYTKVKARFPEDKITAVNVLLMVRLAMEEAEKFKVLEGRQKKELVVRIMHTAFEDYALDDESSAELKVLVDFFVETIIDNFCDINLGHLGINQEQRKKFHAFFRKIMPCCYKE